MGSSMSAIILMYNFMKWWLKISSHACMLMIIILKVYGFG